MKATVLQYQFACENEELLIDFLLSKDLITEDQLDQFANRFSEKFNDFVIDVHEQEKMDQAFQQ